jgi:hypothetical protein
VKLKRLALVADRSAVLFIGVFLGVLIGYAFVPYEVGQSAAVAQPAPISMPSPVSADTDHPSPSMRKAAAEVRPREIGVFGDSFGQGLGLGLGLGRALQFEGAEFKVHQFAKQGTGFTRYAQLNLLEDIRAKLDAHPVDIAVISFGANDTWDIYSGAQVDKYMSPGSKKIIGERVDAVTDLPVALCSPTSSLFSPSRREILLKSFMPPQRFGPVGTFAALALYTRQAEPIHDRRM